MAKNRRRNILIDPGFQIRFIIYLNIILFICLTLYSSIILNVAQNLADHNYITEAQFSELYSKILPYIILINLVIHLAVTVVMLFVSHRIAGPLQRFRIIIASLIKNDYLAKPFNTRKYDYFDGLKDSLNELNIKMKQDYLDKQELINSLVPLLQEKLSNNNQRVIEDLIKKHQN